MMCTLPMGSEIVHLRFLTMIEIIEGIGLLSLFYWFVIRKFPWWLQALIFTAFIARVGYVQLSVIPSTIRSFQSGQELQLLYSEVPLTAYVRADPTDNTRPYVEVQNNLVAASVGVHVTITAQTNLNCETLASISTNPKVISIRTDSGERKLVRIISPIIDHKYSQAIIDNYGPLYAP